MNMNNEQRPIFDDEATAVVVVASSSSSSSSYSSSFSAVDPSGWEEVAGVRAATLGQTSADAEPTPLSRRRRYATRETANSHNSNHSVISNSTTTQQQLNNRSNKLRNGNFGDFNHFGVATRMKRHSQLMMMMNNNWLLIGVD